MKDQILPNEVLDAIKEHALKRYPATKYPSLDRKAYIQDMVEGALICQGTAKDDAPTDNVWISVNDELPEQKSEDGDLLLIHALPINSYERIYGNVRQAVFYKGKFHYEHKNGKIITPTHWQYLPLSPLSPKQA